MLGSIRGTNITSAAPGSAQGLYLIVSDIEADLKQRTLINLYNERPTWLALAHQKLDKAELAAHGWPQGLV